MEFDKENTVDNSTFLDAHKSLDAWLDTVRLRVPAWIQMEIQQRNKEEKFSNRAGINLTTNSFLGTISIVGTGYAGQTAYGHVDYDCIDKISKKGDSLYSQINDNEQLVKKLNEFLDDFIQRVQGQSKGSE